MNIGFSMGRVIFPFSNKQLGGSCTRERKVSKGITRQFSDMMIADQKNEADELAYTFIILHLSNQILRKSKEIRHY